ncbi:unnamed protein product [Camellia sinensis]
MQGVGKAYNELKQGEPTIERFFDLTRFQSKSLKLFQPRYIIVNYLDFLLLSSSFKVLV